MLLEHRRDHRRRASLARRIEDDRIPRILACLHQRVLDARGNEPDLPGAAAD